MYGVSVYVDIVHMAAATWSSLEGVKSDLYTSKAFIFYMKRGNINFTQMWDVGLHILISRVTSKK